MKVKIKNNVYKVYRINFEFRKIIYYTDNKCVLTGIEDLDNVKLIREESDPKFLKTIPDVHSEKYKIKRLRQAGYMVRKLPRSKNVLVIDGDIQYKAPLNSIFKSIFGWS